MLLKRLTCPQSELYLLWSPDIVKWTSPIFRLNIGAMWVFPGYFSSLTLVRNKGGIEWNFLIISCLLFYRYFCFVIIKIIQVLAWPKKEAFTILSDTKTKSHNWVLSWECCSLYMYLKQKAEGVIDYGFSPQPHPLPASSHTGFSVKFSYHRAFAHAVL